MSRSPNSPLDTRDPDALILADKKGFHFPGMEMLARLIALALVFGFFAVQIEGGKFLKPGNLENILRQSAVYATAALGMTMVIITAGIDLSVGSAIALTTVVVAWMLNVGLDFTVQGDTGLIHEYPTIWPIVAVLAAVAMATLMGALNGIMIVGLRLVPFIVTLGMMGIIRGLGKGIARERTVYVMEKVWVKDIMRATLTSTDPARSWMILPPGVWLLIVAAIAAAVLLRYTRLGRHIFAVGSNPETARLCGVSVGRTTIIVYALAGMFAGLAGLMEFAYGKGIGEPTGALGYELYIIAAVVIGGGSFMGGEGTIVGTLIGALIITILRMGGKQAGWDQWVQEVVIGAIIIAAVAIDQLRHRRMT